MTCRDSCKTARMPFFDSKVSCVHIGKKETWKEIRSGLWLCLTEAVTVKTLFLKALFTEVTVNRKKAQLNMGEVAVDMLIDVNGLRDKGQ